MSYISYRCVDTLPIERPIATLYPRNDTYVLTALRHSRWPGLECKSRAPTIRWAWRVCAFMLAVLKPLLWFAIKIFTSITRSASTGCRSTGNAIPAAVCGQIASCACVLSAGIARCYWRRCEYLGASRRIEPTAHTPHALTIIARKDSRHEQQHHSQVKVISISFAPRMPHYTML